MRFITSFVICAILLAAKPAEENSYSEKANEFAWILFSQILKENLNKNIVFSPFSIQQAIAMVYNGSANQTKLSIQNTLVFPDNLADINTHFKTVNGSSVINSKGLNFNISNGLIMQKQYKILKEFTESLQENYNAESRYVDFTNSKHHKKIVSETNNWVAKKTNNKLKQIIQKNDIDELTRLILLNAVSFDCNWQFEFDKQNTQAGNFTNYKGSITKVDFMQQQNTFNYFENKQMQFIELPYKANKFSMMILLPRNKDFYNDIEGEISQNYFDEIEKKMQQRKVQLFLPKFSIEQGLKLNHILQDMGMGIAFSDSADFSGITGSTDLKISRIIHKSMLKVTEEGSEAAAATAVIMKRKTAIIRDMQFKANKPFIYYIKENKSGNILFCGRYINAITY